MKAPYSITARELAARGRKAIPPELQPGQHLIYNSPAALDFNSPGAQGFGVKRAGLAIPGSIMLLISPGCCGRNTAALRGANAYGERFAYFLLDESDIVTGRHLGILPAAVQQFVESRRETPSVVLLCITCADALLGTDMERVCRRAAEAVGLPVLPCYMYALTRESHLPPMTAIRTTVYSLLAPAKKQPAAVNLLGHFAPLEDDCELYAVLRGLGLRHIREIARCRTFAEYQELARANFNLVLNPEARGAASWFEQTLCIPSVELLRLYQLDKIHTQYQLLGCALQKTVDDADWLMDAQEAVDRFCRTYAQETLAIGSRLNANPFELALAMARYGLKVAVIYAAPTPHDFAYLKKLAQASPATRIASSLHPSMAGGVPPEGCADITVAIGEDACYYHPRALAIPWNSERQPFGYAGLKKLFAAMQQGMEGRKGVSPS